VTVLQLSKALTSPPEVTPVPGVRLRTYRGPEDIGPWLQLRHAAFARERLGVRQWTEEDFASEFLDKPWWQPARMWLAEAGNPSEPILVGSVTLAFRGPLPVIHWLIVASTWRRRGVGRLLIGTLESECWHGGLREIALETHAAWERARSFYHALGYGVSES